MAALLCRSPLGGVSLGGVHWLKRPADGFSGGAAFHFTHRWRGDSAAWRSKILATVHDNGRAKGGGAVWRYGGVDG